MNNNFFDENVKGKLDGHEAPVPAAAWDNIQKGKRRRRPLIWLWFLAGLLLCGGGGLYLYTNSQENKTTIAKEETSSQKQNEIANSINPNNNINPDNNESSSNVSAAVEAGDNNNSTTTTNDPAAMVSSSNVKNGIKQNIKQSSSVIKNATINKAVIVATDKIKNNKSASSVIIKTNKNNTIKDDGRVAKKTTLTNAGKTNMKLSGGDLTEDDNSNTTALENTNINNKDSMPATVSIENELSTQSKTMADNHIETKSDTAMVAAPISKKKKLKTGLEIDLSFSGFIPFGSSAAISSVSRTTVTALNKAEFTANDVNIRLQPSAGFNIMLFKSLSAKTKVGAGLGYQHLKEYITLSGEEVNTNYAIVKRLHNGNSLVDDTVTSVTKGIRNIDAVNSYSLLSIPLSFRYKVWSQNKWELNLSAGIDISVQSKYKNSIAGELRPQFAVPNNTSRNNSFGIGYNAGAVLGRSVGKNYFIYLSPYIQLNPKKIYLNEMLSPAKINRAGVSFGLSYGL